MPPTLDCVADKQPIKWMDLPIMKFNEIAVPHHVNRLKALKISIQKHQRIGDWNGVYREQTNAAVIVKQLRTLVNEMDALRGRVIDSDVHKFDRMISSSRQAALNVLQEFIDLSHQLANASKDELSSSEANECEEECLNDERLQQCLDVSRLAAECRQQEKCAIAWETLQKEIEEVHQLYNELAQIVDIQGDSLNKIETNVEVTHEEIVQGEKHLRQIVDMKTASYPLYGAIIGTCVGGPVGFLAGVKIGGLVALTGSILGFTGGRILKTKESCE